MITGGLGSVGAALPCRRTFPAEAFQTRFSNLTDIVRIWDFYSPDYNCPLLKERVGEPWSAEAAYMGAEWLVLHQTLSCTLNNSLPWAEVRKTLAAEGTYPRRTRKGVSIPL